MNQAASKDIQKAYTFFATEMWERFCYMVRAILILFMTQALFSQMISLLISMAAISA